jgi:hypothetical protein
VVIALINPVGEFMINDDWTFVRSLEILISEGRLAPTGWGPSWAPGGPALLTHLVWGRLFTYFWGFSLTGLRISVLTLAILGSVALLILLRSCKAGAVEALWATLTVVFNPLFLSQSFTYMTDVTFAVMMIFSLLFLAVGTQGRKFYLIVLGLLFALLAILTRQLGFVIPVAFVLVCFVHPAGRKLGTWKAFFLTLVLVIIPWMAYEYYLSVIGSTPLSHHLVFQEIFLHPREMGLVDYLLFLYDNLFTFGLTYVAFFISPVLALKYRFLISWTPFKYFALLLTGLFVLFEIALIVGAVEGPVIFGRNVIFNLGLGPILLKDMYILRMQRPPLLPPSFYYLVVYWTILSVVAVLRLAYWSFARMLKRSASEDDSEIVFLPCLALIAGLLYLFIIMLSGYYDRYLIAACVLFVIWLVSDRETSAQTAFRPFPLVIAAAPFVLFLGSSVCLVHDFMELKRTQKQAFDYLVQEKSENPCHMDGGFEFNGYHCYDPNFRAVKGFSWWWVHKEDYVITLGPLSGYQTVRTFPFTRYYGPPAAIHILKPLPQESR